jgi:hypothetical protein
LCRFGVGDPRGWIRPGHRAAFDAFAEKRGGRIKVVLLDKGRIRVDADTN